MLHPTRYRLGSVLVGVSVALTGACQQDGAELSTAPSFSHVAELSKADVFVGAVDPSGAGPAIGTLVGRSLLVRNADGLRGIVKTSGLTPGDVVTLWFVAFQDPDNCTGACDNPGEDLAPGRAAVSFGGGAVVPRNGLVTIEGSFDVGGELIVLTTPNGPSADVFDTPIGSEVHLVVRTHGAIVPDQFDEQMGSFNGGCPPNTCVSLQAGVHGRQ